MWDPEYCDSELRAVEASGDSRDELCPCQTRLKLMQAALVYTVIVYMECVTICLSQMTNVNRFSKGETTKTATELACCMVSD